MRRFIVRRLVQSVFLLFGITLITFTISHLAPGGPDTLIEDPNISPDYLARLRTEYGLDQPLPVQYASWVGNLVRLNFGRSFEDNRPVLDKILERVPATLELSLAGLLLGLLGVPLGIQAAVHRGGFVDGAVRIFTVVGQALPHWWLGLMIIIITAPFGIFPLGGIADPNRPDDLLSRVHHLVLPAIITAMTGWIVFSRFVRSELLEVLGQDYVRTARGKGLAGRLALRRHALPNALLPVITLLGNSLAPLFSGAVLFETVFSWPGMGRLAVTAAFRRDYPTVMALTVLVAVLVIIGNLLADLAYGYCDPRVRYD
jgi:peptide/nickel transport system permease protein